MPSKLSVPKKIELAFDSIYLCSATIIGCCLIFTATNDAKRAWGIMALILAGGDAFHLVPRMAAAYSGKVKEYTKAMGIGKLITSLTMTIFYVLLWHLALTIFSLELPVQTAILYGLVGIRILLCLLPQNKWQDGGEGIGTFLPGIHPTSESCEKQKGIKMGIYRNIPFFLQGMLVLWVYASYAGNMPALRFVWVAILLSFLCYLPVVVGASDYPKLGMLMLPKTCAYLWIVSIGFWIL